MKTPLRRLIDLINSYPNLTQANIVEKAKSLLPEEKQMVTDAYDEALFNHRQENGEQYFNETFEP